MSAARNPGNHEIEVRGFVDVRLDNVGEWGEEDPGAFMATGGIEQLTLSVPSGAQGTQPPLGYTTAH
jgi:hypothetical protein